MESFGQRYSLKTFHIGDLFMTGWENGLSTLCSSASIFPIPFPLFTPRSFNLACIRPVRSCPTTSIELDSLTTWQQPRDFLHVANEMDYGLLPFCVLGVWEVQEPQGQS